MASASMLVASESIVMRLKPKEQLASETVQQRDSRICVDADDGEEHKRYPMVELYDMCGELCAK